ncbi:DUF1837 domain-containing protein [Pseudoalteromonas lipolytica]|uniref:HamA C-terminal domain-containing protein n=1 Tax=Pseudoalteromonas lipolytica TaxID=570156 RepID=UPI003095DC31
MIINSFASVDKESYESCIGCLEHEFNKGEINTRVRLHYLKFNGNGEPMVKALANLLYEFIIDYCISSANRPEVLSARDSARLTKEARNLFRHPTIDEDNPDRTGEAGELLLFFLIEAVLGAPQIVSKMELKTNHRDEVKGSDGIHARYNEDEALVDFFFGEAKLYVDPIAAISAALKSIDDFHSVDMLAHEFNMVTKYFKYSNEQVKKAISSLIISGEVGPEARINHACLIGYNFKDFKNLNGNSPTEVMNDFMDKFLKDSEKLVEKLNLKVSQMKSRKLAFDVFFLPFPSVDEFRNAFNQALD